jgi:hypothetical protein
VEMDNSHKCSNSEYLKRRSKKPKTYEQIHL